MKQQFGVLIFLILGFASCVPNKKYVFLQKNDVNINELPNDTILRSYDNKLFDYKIQPEDILSIKIESLTPQEFDFFDKGQAQGNQMFAQQANPLLIGEIVDAEGNVPFPVIGKVRIAGYTIYQAQDTLQQLANQYLQSPMVKVRLLNFRMTILGEVNNEGTITFTNNRVNMMEAIGLAGGLSDLADKRNIKLIRQKEGGSTVQYIDLLDENFIASPNFYVNQNDILIVPALRQRPYRKYFGQNISLVVSLVSLMVLTLNLTK